MNRQLLYEGLIKSYKTLLEESHKFGYPDWFKEFLRDMKSTCEKILKEEIESRKFAQLN